MFAPRIKRYIQLVAGLFCAAALSALPQSVWAATLTFSPSSGSFPVGKEFTVKLTVDPGSDKINAADGTIAFDSSVVSVTSVTKEGSIFSLWTADPTFSNSDGTVTFSGGTPTPKSSSGTVIVLTLKGKKVGTAAISLSKGSVLAADGKGTDVYSAGNPASLTITAAVVEAPPPADTTDAGVSDLAGGVLPLPAVITSTTHPKPENWYATSTATFTWKPPPDVLAVRTLLADSPTTTTPLQLQKGIINAQTLQEVADGTRYFLVQYKNDSGWGPPGNLKINIDTVPPNDFDIAIATPASKTDVPKFAFKADDALSGIDRYEILFGTSTVATAHLKDMTDGTYPIPPQGGGVTQVTIKAYDKAGNFREVKRMLTLPFVAKPAAKEDAPAPTAQGGTPLWVYILLVVLALTTGALFAINRQAKKVAEVEKSRILNRVLEIREKNDRIFTAMREEFEQMVQDFDEKPQLTPQERDLLEGIREVLDISEGLVDTMIEELKKDVRGK